MSDKVLFVMDAHSRGGKRAADSRFALRQALRLAEKHEVGWMVYGGDTVDQQRNRSAPILDVFEIINEARRKNIKSAFIQGQHDWDEPPWFLGAQALHLHKQTLIVGGKKIYGLDFTTAEKLPDELAAIPKDTHLLVAHQVWSEWMGDIASPQGSFADVPYVKQIISGDLHQYALENHRNKQGHKIKVCSPGATYQKAINEPSEHFVVLWDSAEGSFEPLKLRSRKFIDWDQILSPDELEEFVAKIGPEIKKAVEAAEKYPEDVRKPLLRVTYSCKLENVRRRIRKVVGDSAILHEKELPPEEKLKKAKALSGKQAAVTPLTELPQVVSKDEEPEVFNLLTRTLQAPDKERRAQELDRFLAEFMQAD